MVRRIDIGGISLRVDQSGNPDPANAGANFVCVHGLADTLDIWNAIEPGLAGLGRVIRMDQRGHGDWDAARGAGSREDLARDVLALMGRLHVPNAVLVGHSLGGMVAVQAALLAPERVSGLALLGTATHCNERAAGWYERIAQAGDTRGIGGLTRAIYGADTRKKLAGDAAGIAAVTRTLISLYREPLTDRLGELRCPVLTLVGDRDPLGTRASELIVENAPVAESEVLRGVGHWCQVESPELVLEALERWLPRVSLPR